MSGPASDDGAGGGDVGPSDEDFFPNNDDAGVLPSSGDDSGNGEGNGKDGKGKGGEGGTAPSAPQAKAPTPTKPTIASLPSPSPSSSSSSSRMRRPPPSEEPLSPGGSSSSGASSSLLGLGGGGLGIGQMGQSLRNLQRGASEARAAVAASAAALEARCDERLERLENRIIEGVSAARKAVVLPAAGAAAPPETPTKAKAVSDAAAGSASKSTTTTTPPPSAGGRGKGMELARGLGASIRNLGSRQGSSSANDEEEEATNPEGGGGEDGLAVGPARIGTAGCVGGGGASGGSSWPQLPKVDLSLPKMDVSLPKMDVSLPKVDEVVSALAGLGDGVVGDSSAHGEGGGGAKRNRNAYVPVQPVITTQLTDPDTGDIYEGPVDADGVKHGDGAVVNRKDGSKFLGRYVKNKARYGTLIKGDETYNGPLIDWKYDTRRGTGEEDDDNNGDANDEEEEMVGTLTKSDGTVYSGGFRRGTYDGRGKLSLPDGSSYDGMFLRGNYDGKGTFLDPSNGYSYGGTWRDGRKEGEGIERTIQKTEDGKKDKVEEAYEGQFRDDVRAGSGRLSLPDGTVAEGWWRRGAPADGPGWTIVRPNGDRYYGKAAGYRPDGMGTMKYTKDSGKGGSNGKGGGMYSGEWRDGRRHGRGMRVYADKSKEEGVWEDDVLVDGGGAGGGGDER